MPMPKGPREHRSWKPSCIFGVVGTFAALFFASWSTDPLDPLGGAPVTGQEPHKRVLIMHSFGQNFSPYDEFTALMQEQLTRMSPTPIEFFGASLETARFAETNTEGPLADYLSSLFEEQDFDLVVSIGGPARRFCMRYREHLFGSAPLLVAGVADRHRLLHGQPVPAGVALVTIRFDLLAVVDEILELIPETSHIAVVFGGSAWDRLWLEEFQRELGPREDRIRFTWLHGLPSRELRDRVADLPPATAILYVMVTVDGEGVPQRQDRALRELNAVAAAPIFGFFDHQLGKGIVGGSLISMREATRRAAVAALRILDGEAPEDVRMEVLAAGDPVFDFRELQRWDIPADRLPPGSSVSHRPPSVVEEYTGPVILVLGALVLQTALIARLLVNRARRRRAEEQAISLSRRMMQAHEDERRRLARDLHDDLSQRLAKLAIEASQVQRACEGGSAEVPAVRMRQDLASLADDVHALSYRLHPSVLYDLGLCEAIRVECDEFSRAGSTLVELGTCDCDREPPQPVSLALFRIAQEALRNVARHANASRVAVSLVETDHGLMLTVEDDGVGFVPARRPDHPSLGHDSMRERALAVRGTLEIESAPGRGTTVRAWVPFEGAPA